MSSDDERPVEDSLQPAQQRSDRLLVRVVRYISSQRVVFKWFAITAIAGIVCITVVYCIRANRSNLETLKGTIQRLREIIELLSRKIESQNSMIQAQQQSILGLLQTLESKFESQDKKTREMVQSSIDKVQHLNRSMQQLSQQFQKPVGMEKSLENTIGSVVVQGSKAIVSSVTPWPLNIFVKLLK